MLKRGRWGLIEDAVHVISVSKLLIGHEFGLKYTEILWALIMISRLSMDGWITECKAILNVRR